MSDHKEAKSFSRFGYIMVAAGAAIGLGNIWKFPYLAYGDGGGAFVLIYIVICILLGHPIVQAEQAVGRRGRASAAASAPGFHPILATDSSPSALVIITIGTVRAPLFATTSASTCGCSSRFTTSYC